MKRKISKKYSIILSVIVFLLISGITGFGIYKSFSSSIPVKTVTLSSESFNYEEQEGGAWKLNQTAEFISDTEAVITYELDTIEKNNYKKNDYIFVIDHLSYYNDAEVESFVNLVKDILSDKNNRIALVTNNNFMFYEEDEEVECTRTFFTSDLSRIVGTISSLQKDFYNYDQNITKIASNDRRSNYKFLVAVDELLTSYYPSENTKVNVIMVANVKTNKHYPNEVAQYELLKTKYPYLNINLVYRSDVLYNEKYFDSISDAIYLSNSDNFYNIGNYATLDSDYYKKFNISSYIDNNYFEVIDIEDSVVSQGIVTLTEDNGKQVVNWDLSNYQSGIKEFLRVKVKLKSEYVNVNGTYSVSKKNVVKYEISEKEEKISSISTPKLKNYYNVSYSDNAPTDCSIDGSLPETKTFNVFNSVDVSESKLSCGDYAFDGWKTSDETVMGVNTTSFVMPERDVVLNATWRKTTLVKSMDGEVHEEAVSLMERGSSYTMSHDVWAYAGNITQMIIQNELSPIEGAYASYDISYANDGSVMAYLVKDIASSTYTLYLQGNKKIYLNSYSRNIFANFYQLESITGIEYLDTSLVENMAGLFSGDKALKNIDVSNFDVSRVTDVSSMFANCSSLEYVDLSNFIFMNSATMASMFYQSGVKEVILPKTRDDNRNISVDFSSMFSQATNLETFTFDNIYTAYSTQFSYMFSGCSSLKNVDMTGMIGSSTTSYTYKIQRYMANMFLNCTSLESIDLSNVDRIYLKNCEKMFSGCSSLLSLDTSKFDTTECANMQSMFSGCSSLTKLDVSYFNTENVLNMSYMFSGCSKLVDLNVNINTSAVKNMNSMFSGCSSLTKIDLSSFDTAKVEDMASMFSGCSSMTDFILTSFDTTSVKTMFSMFANCASVKNIDLSSFNTKSVTTMEKMFQYCESLEELDLTSFNTSTVTTMEYMFSNCKSITDIDLSSFDTSGVETIDSMFSNCEAIEKIDLSSFDTSNIWNMAIVFRGCKNLKELDLSSFNTENVQYLSYMFADCTSLVDLDLSNFYTPKLIAINNMFENDENLVNLDISHLDITNVTSYSYFRMAFYNCVNIKTEIILKNTPGSASASASDCYTLVGNAATNEGSKFVLSYTSTGKNFARNIYRYAHSYHSTSNVVYGTDYTSQSIAIDDDRVSANVQILSNYVQENATTSDINNRVELVLKNVSGAVTSFRLNGTLMEGNAFYMPGSSAVITDITIKEFAEVETTHNPYTNGQNKQYYSGYFDGAEKIRVTLTYQTEGLRYDYVSIYDSSTSTTPVGKYGGLKKVTEVIYVNSDYIKIMFNSDSSGNEYYGFHAYIEPVYPE